MSAEERRARAGELRRRARSRTPAHWLAEVRARGPGPGRARAPAPAAEARPVRRGPLAGSEPQPPARRGSRLRAAGPSKVKIGRLREGRGGTSAPATAILSARRPEAVPSESRARKAGRSPVSSPRSAALLEARAQLGHDGPLVDPERERELHARLAPAGPTGRARPRSPSQRSVARRRSPRARHRRAITRAPVDRYPVVLVLDLGPPVGTAGERADRERPRSPVASSAPRRGAGRSRRRSLSSSPCRPMARSGDRYWSSSRRSARNAAGRPETAATTASSRASSWRARERARAAGGRRRGRGRSGRSSRRSRSNRPVRRRDFG